MNIRQRLNQLIKLSNELSDNDDLPDDEWQEQVDKELSEKDRLKDEQDFKQKEKSYLGNDPKGYDRKYKEVIRKILDFEGFSLLYYDKNPVLGAGFFGTVFEGVFEGKPAAAKLILDYRTSKEDSEVDNWQAILDLRQSMPVEFLAYIPEIYRLNKGTVEYNREDLGYEIIIMEKLFPISKNEDLKAVYREPYEQNNRDDLFTAKINNLLKDEEFLYYIALNISSKALSLYNLQIDINHLHKAMLMSKIKIGPNKSVDHKSTEFFTNVIVTNLLKDYPKYNQQIYYDILYNDIFSIVNYCISSFVNRAAIPSRKHVNRLGVEYLPHMPEGYFFKFLDYLDSQGIKFRDLKENNLMVGLDGNIKLIDVGLYGKV